MIRYVLLSWEGDKRGRWGGGILLQALRVKLPKQSKHCRARNEANVALLMESHAKTVAALTGENLHGGQKGAKKSTAQFCKRDSLHEAKLIAKVDGFVSGLLVGENSSHGGRGKGKDGQGGGGAGGGGESPHVPP